MGENRAKTAVITGAQKGIGADISKLLIEQNVNVIMNYLDDDHQVADLVRQAKKFGIKAKAVQADVSSKVEAQSLIDSADEFGGIDYLVSNAAIYPRVSLLDMTEQDWEQVLSVNLKGSFFAIQAAAKKMIANGKCGSIVTVASGAAVKGAINGAHYSASKSGLFGLTKSAALEFAQHGIRANIVAPGLVDTDQPRLEFSEQELEGLWKSHPLKGKTEPQDVADMIYFLLSHNSRRVTGQVFHINGGALMP